MKPGSSTPGPVRRVLRATRSAFRRYPRHLAQSLRAPTSHAHSHSPIALTLPTHALAAAWLGHATTLLRVGGLTVLTDPVLSDRIGPRLGPFTLGIHRHRNIPAVELPPVDVILLSHAHFDHLDKPTLRRLADRRTTVLTARNTARLVPPGFGRIVELDWGCAAMIDGVEFGALRPAHWGARSAWDRHRGFNSYMLSSRAGKILFAGDTAHTDAFNNLCPDLAVFGIGAYDPWINAHANPEQVWRMFRAANAAHLMPIHHSTFELSDEHRDEPIARLMAAAGDESHRIVGREPARWWAA